MLSNLTEMAYLEGSIWALVRHKLCQWKFSSWKHWKVTHHWIHFFNFLPWQLYDAFPGLMKHLPGPHNRIFSSSRSLVASIREEIEKHKLDLDPNNPRDYVDSFLIKEKVCCLHSPKIIITVINKICLVTCMFDSLLCLLAQQKHSFGLWGRKPGSVLSGLVPGWQWNHFKDFAVGTHLSYHESSDPV